ncbi:hypothetical protein N8580_04070 [Akkermansiaceae bacterium]|nr:hypothetical protein [Akkermansiaceae bacterium]MDB4142946.1 hypothetical protein [Akkermansiaceae bacterium]MDB4681950.1 hypothetical protein [Akkermansiaceae bacterium]
MIVPGSSRRPARRRCRRRVKEQLNKRKKDDEFANINLGFIDASGKEVIVVRPESAGVEATLSPRKSKTKNPELITSKSPAIAGPAREVNPEVEEPAEKSTSAPEPPEKELSEPPEPQVEKVSTKAEPEQPPEKEIRIFHGDRGHSYRTLFLDYLKGAKKVYIEDPYIRLHHQISNFLRFCEVCAEAGTVESIELVTDFDDPTQKQEADGKLQQITNSLAEHGIELKIKTRPTLHDRRIDLDNGWSIILGRGLDFYQRPDDWFDIGANELYLRQCFETTVGFKKRGV